MAIPTTEELYQQQLVNMQSALGQAVQILPKAFLPTLARVVAAGLHLLYLFSAEGRRNIWASSASSETTTVGGVRVNPLQEIGRRVRAGLPDPGAAAVLSLSVPTHAGGSIDAGAQLANEESGLVFSVVSSVSTVEGTTTVRVRCIGTGEADSVGTGTQGNLAVGSVLTWLSQPAYATAATATVAAVYSQGSDPETADAYRARVIDAEAVPVHGGSLADYRAWAKTSPNIDRAWAYRGAIPGQIVVYVSSSTSTYGDATAEQLADVLGRLKSSTYTTNPTNYDRAPLGDLDSLTVRSVTVTPLTMVIGALSLPNGISQTVVKTAVQEALTKAVDSYEPYVEGLSSIRNDHIEASVLLGEIVQVVRSYGGTVGACYLQYQGSTVPQYLLGEGELARLGGVSWSV